MTAGAIHILSLPLVCCLFCFSPCLLRTSSVIPYCFASSASSLQSLPPFLSFPQSVLGSSFHPCVPHLPLSLPLPAHLPSFLPPCLLPGPPWLLLGSSPLHFPTFELEREGGQWSCYSRRHAEDVLRRISYVVRRRIPLLQDSRAQASCTSATKALCASSLDNTPSPPCANNH